MTLTGLTVVLIDNGVDAAHDAAMMLALEGFIAQRAKGDDLRVFSVSERLIELMVIPETFATFHMDENLARVGAAVNRLNILKPARIVVLADALRGAFGRTREGTRGYIWCPTARPATSVVIGWTVLTTEPSSIVAAIRDEEEKDGVGQAAVR